MNNKNMLDWVGRDALFMDRLSGHEYSRRYICLRICLVGVVVDFRGRR